LKAVVCLFVIDTSAGASKANITELSRVGSYLNLFPNKTIPVDGYLVGWKYYLSPLLTDQFRCTSYVGVWRPMSVDKFQIISRTKLTQQTSQEGGVRFQFVQNEIFRVEAGDILSIFSDNISICRSYVSSMTSSIQTSERGYNFPIKEQDISANGFVLKSDGGTSFRNPALKAYVSSNLTYFT